MLRGHWFLEHRRSGQVIGRADGKNTITNIGMNTLLDTMFRQATQADDWYIGLYTGTGAATDEIDNHPGWTEAETQQPWVPDASADRVIENSTAVEFTITAAATINGMFISSMVGSEVGILWCVGAFVEARTVAVGDTIRIIYQITG